jgi:hypothetical protein
MNCEMMTPWETIGWRVTWLESHHFPGEPPTEHSKTVENKSEVLDLLRSITKKQPVTERPIYRPQVVQLQRRLEIREMPCGLAGWER